MRMSKRFQTLAVLGVLALGLTAVHSAVVSLPADSASAEERSVYLSLSDGVETVEAGKLLVYTVTVRLDGSVQKSVRVSMKLPNYANTVEASDSGRRDGAWIVWDNVVLDPQTTRRLYVNIGVDPYVSDGTILVAQAECDGETAVDNTEVSGREMGRDPSFAIRVNDGKKFAVPEEELRYIIEVENISEWDDTFELRTE
ncbi:MAG: hypothetical protein PHI23_04600, partial [Candidatus Peribacteraceae bacterium]|nr:hypothetical protein [Candidatus Peribacteraceae bacterium]